MRIKNEIYFAPGIKFTDIVWDNPEYLVDAFRRRVHGYYLDQAYLFVRNWNCRVSSRGNKENLGGLAFGSGLICSAAIDLLARIELYPRMGVGKRYVEWLEKRIPLFNKSDPDKPERKLSSRFYDDFRNGLVHEGRIKDAGQFSFDHKLFLSNGLYEIVDKAMVVNPARLLINIADGLDQYLLEINQDASTLEAFRTALLQIFSFDIEHVKDHG